MYVKYYLNVFICNIDKYYERYGWWDGATSDWSEDEKSFVKFVFFL